MDSGTTVEHDRKRFIFYVNNETNFIKQIRVITEVDDPEQYYFYEGVSPQERRLGENYNYELHIKDELVRDLQRIESILALSGNLKRVNWQKSTLEYYPETEAEHNRVQLMPPWFFLWEFQPDDPTELSVDNLVRMVSATDVLKPLIVPMAFYREGRNEYRVGRYIGAFFNFYFVIEGLFGNGQWRTDDVIRELLKSPVFTTFVQQLLDKVAKNGDLAEGLTKAQLEQELKSRGQDYTPEGLIKLVVKKRGELHHFSVGSTKQQGTPFNNLDYKIITFISLDLAGKSIIHYITEEQKKKAVD
jgi:hypothetical protein